MYVNRITDICNSVTYICSYLEISDKIADIPKFVFINICKLFADVRKRLLM